MGYLSLMGVESSAKKVSLAIRVTTALIVIGVKARLSWWHFPMRHP